MVVISSTTFVMCGFAVVITLFDECAFTVIMVCVVCFVEKLAHLTPHAITVTRLTYHS